MDQRIDCPILPDEYASTLDRRSAILDLAWRGDGQSRWVAARTEEGDHLVRRFPHANAKAGILLCGGLVEWRFDGAAQMPDLARRIARWEADVRQDMAHYARVAAAGRSVDDGGRLAVQADLAAMLGRSRWAFRSNVPLAEKLAGAATLTPGQLRLARALVTEAGDVVAAVDRRLAGPTP